MYNQAQFWLSFPKVQVLGVVSPVYKKLHQHTKFGRSVVGILEYNG